jgi:hypothetical protein
MKNRQWMMNLHQWNLVVHNKSKKMRKVNLFKMKMASFWVKFLNLHLHLLLLLLLSLLNNFLKKKSSLMLLRLRSMTLPLLIRRKKTNLKRKVIDLEFPEAISAVQERCWLCKSQQWCWLKCNKSICISCFSVKTNKCQW